MAYDPTAAGLADSQTSANQYAANQAENAAARLAAQQQAQAIALMQATAQQSSATKATDAANANTNAPLAGTASGQYAANQIAADPALQGLYKAAGLGTGGTSSGGVGGTGGMGGGSVGVGGAGTAGVLSSATGIGGSSGIPGIAPVDMSASNAATFGAAKDQAGQTGRSQIDSMKGLIGAAGMLGGGAEAAGTRNIVEQAGQGVNDVTRANATNTAASNLDVAKTNQASQLTQRGQDIAAQQAQAQLAMEQAQLNSQRQLSLLQTALGATSSIPSPGSLY